MSWKSDLHPALKDWKNLALAGLSLLVVIQFFLLLSDGAHHPGPVPTEGGLPVSVLDALVDRENRSHLDLLLDRPVASDRVGEVLAAPAADIQPSISGQWRWEGSSVLRFVPDSRLQMATDYRLQLQPAAFLSGEEVFHGDRTVTVRTDQFRVERVHLSEEWAPGASGGVIVRGEVVFNYPVEPDAFLAAASVSDPLRSDPVPLQLETRRPDRSLRFRTTPIVKQRTERNLQLTISQSLQPVTGNVGLASDFVESIAIGSNETLTVRNVSTSSDSQSGTVEIRFSSPVDPSRARQFVEVEPAIDYRLSATDTRLLLEGAFEPGSTYSLHLRQGLRGRDDSVLPGTFETTVRVPDLTPRIEFTSAGEFLSARGLHKVGVESVNLAQTRLRIDRVYRNNLFVLFQNYRYLLQRQYFSPLARALGGRVAEETLQLGGARNEVVEAAIDLDNFIDNESPGLYRVALSRPDQPHQASQRWVLVTDLGIVAKRGREEMTVWVSSFETLEAVSGAEVTLISDQNQPLSRGRTDSRGLWRARNLSPEARPYMVTVTRGSDFSFLVLQRHGVSTTGLDVAGDRIPEEGYQAFVYGERDLYRPGEEVEGVAVVRDQRLRVPPSMPLQLRHLDPRGQRLSEESLRLGPQGTAEFALQLAGEALTGTHQLEVRIADSVVGRYRFQVEEFVPDRIRIELDVPAEALTVEERLEFGVSGQYLFGPPAAGLAVEARVEIRPATFRPEGFEAFRFGRVEEDFEGLEIFHQSGVLNEAGRRSFGVVVPPQLEVPSSLQAVVTARIQERAGRGVTTRRRLQVHPFPYYIGIEAPETVSVDRSAGFEYVCVSAEDERIGCGQLEAQFSAIRWNRILRRTDGGGYRYESSRQTIPLQTRTVAAGAAGGTLSWRPPTHGNYLLRLRSVETGATTEVEFYTSGWNVSPWTQRNPGLLQLELDQPEYQRGQTAEATVTVPFPGRLWITVERETILDSRIISVAAGTTSLRVPVQADYGPNAYLTATLIATADDVEEGMGGRAYGAVRLNVARSRHRLPLQLTAVEQMRPERPLTVQVATTPGAAVTIAAVDEGILQLISQETPDAFEYFYRQRALGVSTADIFALLLPEVNLESLSSPGGGAGVAAGDLAPRTGSLRRPQPVAFWSGVLVAEADGTVETSFDVPDFQGRLRLMALAHGDADFGSATAEVIVRQPLVLMPAFPRVLAFGDTVRLPVTVRNDTGSEGLFEVRVSAAGPAGLSDPSRRVELAEAGEATVYFDLETEDREGALEIRIEASGNGEQARSRDVLQVRSDLPEMSRVQSGALLGPITTLDPSGARFRPGAERRLRISRVPLLQMGDELSRLLRYPYGCLEQTVSRAFPLLYLSDLVRELDPDYLASTSAEQLAENAIARLRLFQYPDGGFAAWPATPPAYVWGSVYAAHFLVEARKAGYYVDDYFYARVLGWLTELVRNPGRVGRRLESQAYAHFVLARAGESERGALDDLRQRQLARLPSFGRVLLAGAYRASGDPEIAADLLAGVSIDADTGRSTGGSLSSVVRDRALLLLTLLDTNPDDARIAPLAEFLARSARTSRWSTQETAFAFLALGALVRRQEAAADFAGRVTVDGVEVARFNSDGGEFQLSDQGRVQVELESGYEAGAAFYLLSERGVPLENAYQPVAEGLDLQVDYLDRNGEPLSLSGIRQGDLVVVRTRLRSRQGRVDNVAVEALLAGGLEVENPRLDSSETLPWLQDSARPRYVDVRRDRILLFVDLPAGRLQTYYSLLRAVSPGNFRLPPVQAEAMYDPRLQASTARGRMEVEAVPSP